GQARSMPRPRIHSPRRRPAAWLISLLARGCRCGLATRRCRWDLHCQRPLRYDAPVLRRSNNCAIVDQHLHQFFHVAGVAFGTVGDELRERRAHIGDPLQQRFDQFLTDALVEGGEDDSGMTFLAASPRGTPLIERGTREARDEQWASNNQTTWGSSSIQFW